MWNMSFHHQAIPPPSTENKVFKNMFNRGITFVVGDFAWHPCPCRLHLDTPVAKLPATTFQMYWSQDVGQVESPFQGKSGPICQFSRGLWVESIQLWRPAWSAQVGNTKCLSFKLWNPNMLLVYHCLSQHFAVFLPCNLSCYHISPG
jgi:hypothetical protein